MCSPSHPCIRTVNCYRLLLLPMHYFLQSTRRCVAALCAHHYPATTVILFQHHHDPPIYLGRINACSTRLYDRYFTFFFVLRFFGESTKRLTVVFVLAFPVTVTDDALFAPLKLGIHVNTSLESNPHALWNMLPAAGQHASYQVPCNTYCALLKDHTTCTRKQP